MDNLFRLIDPNTGEDVTDSFVFHGVDVSENKMTIYVEDTRPKPEYEPLTPEQQQWFDYIDSMRLPELLDFMGFTER